MGAIDVRLREIEFAAFFQILGQTPQGSMQRAVLSPGLKATMARLVRRVPRRQVCPRCARSQDPQHTIHDVAWVAPRSPATLGGALEFLRRKVRLDGFPLLVGQIHHNGRSENRSRVDPPSTKRLSLKYLQRAGL
jgi:hypothetical protein